MRYRSGLTWLEVLVVIGIIGILMGLLIPAVNRSHTPARGRLCATNLKNFALAATQHDHAKQHLPGFMNDYGTFVGEVEPSRTDLESENLATHRKIGSWAITILPWLDAQPTYEVWTEDRYSVVAFGTSLKDVSPEGYLSNAAPNLAIFQCPSNPNGDDEFGRNSYICNSGMYHRGPVGEDEWTISRFNGETVVMNLERSMSVANGAFNNQVACVDASGNPVPVGPKVTLEDFKDGQGNTILFSENVQAMPWHRIGFAIATDLVVNDPSDPIRYPEAARYVHGMVWHYEDDKQLGGTAKVNPVHLINGNLTGKSDGSIFTVTMTPENAADLARPSSAHVDGVNAGMADGSTRFIPDSIDYRVYQALLTPRGKNSDVPFLEFVITDESFGFR